MRLNREVAIRLLCGFAIVIGAFAIFQPWIYERFLLRSWTGQSLLDTSRYWPFQAIIEHGNIRTHLLLDAFWFSSSERYSHHPAIYYGWFAVFLSQVLAIAFGTVYVLKPRKGWRSWQIDAALGFSVFSLGAAFYQRFVQLEMRLKPQFRYLSMDFSRGFWIAVLSTLILLVSCGSQEKEKCETCWVS